MVFFARKRHGDLTVDSIHFWTVEIDVFFRRWDWLKPRLWGKSWRWKTWASMVIRQMIWTAWSVQKWAHEKFHDAGRTSDPKRSKMHTSSEHYASQNMENLTQPSEAFFFQSLIGSASQNQWFASGNVPHAFRDFLRQFLASQVAETPERPERWISKGLKKEKVTYPIDTISLYIHIYVYLSEHI